MTVIQYPDNNKKMLKYSAFPIIKKVAIKMNLNIWLNKCRKITG